MGPKRPIDYLRDSAGSMTIGNDADGPITELISLGDALLVVKARSIYAVKLADQIDPERINSAVPNTHQMVLRIGADDSTVARTLLTAHTLFKKSFLGNSFDEVTALASVFDLVKDFAAMTEMQGHLEDAESEIAKRYETAANVTELPALGDCKARLDGFAQQAGHIVTSLEAITKHFYGDVITSKWIDSLVKVLTETRGTEDGFTKALTNFGRCLLV